MMEITIQVDTNDADYLTEVREISQKDFDVISPLIRAIKAFKPYKGKHYMESHNYSVGDAYRPDLGEKGPRELYDFSEEVFEKFEEFLPSAEHGFHTIESITIGPLSEKTELL